MKFFTLNKHHKTFADGNSKSNCILSEAKLGSQNWALDICNAMLLLSKMPGSGMFLAFAILR